MDLAAGLVALAVLLAIGALAAIAILAFGDRTGRKSSTPPTRARISASQHPAQRAPTRTVPKASIDALHSNPERSQAPARDDSQPLPPPPARAQPNIQLIPAVPVPSKETAPVPA
ncbi:MAG: hypothetical protein LH624_18105, partial [Cryobacterium sp.]|nr:hypothetical protein [Cryobacterium sp.]